MAAIDLDSLDEYIDQRIDAKLNSSQFNTLVDNRVNAINYGRFSNLKIAAWCQATGDATASTPRTIVAGYNIKSITYSSDPVATWQVEFNTPVNTLYFPLVSVEASGVAAEIHGVYDYQPQGFKIDNVKLLCSGNSSQFEAGAAIVNNIGASYPATLNIIVWTTV